MRFLLFALALVLLVSATVSSQPVVVLDTLTGGLCGNAAYSHWSTQVVSICNPDTVQYNVDLAFRVHPVASDGGPVDVELEFYNGFLDYLKLPGVGTIVDYSVSGDNGDLIVSIQTWDLPHSPEEMGVPGLPASSDTIPYIGIRFRPRGDAFGAQICLDSATTAEIPVWVMNPGVYPAFGGSKCYAVDGPWPNMDMFQFHTDNGGAPMPEEVSVNDFCSPVSVRFFLEQLYGGGPYKERNDRVKITVEGPGEVVHIGGVHDWYEYRYYPDSADAGKTFTVELEIGYDYCGDGNFNWYGGWTGFSLIVTPNYVVDDPVQFAPQYRRFVATTGDTLKINLKVEDDGPCLDHRYSWFVNESNPVPSHAWIDSLTGTFYYLGTSADTGVYVFYEVVSELGAADTAWCGIKHFENFLCGDLDRDGVVTMGDLTYLISTLFIDLLPPAPPEAGNVDCEPGLTMGDLTVMIDHLYITLSPMCNCL